MQSQVENTDDLCGDQSSILHFNFPSSQFKQVFKHPNPWNLNFEAKFVMSWIIIDVIYCLLCYI